jgi:hypothetical protein
MNTQPIDIFILCYKRESYTRKTLEYLFERTKYPIRVFLLIQENDSGNNFIADSMFKDKIFMKVNFSLNMGVHAAWNVALALAASEYFITSDNDIYVPDLKGANLSPFYGKSEGELGVDALRAVGLAPSDDWLGRLVGFMQERPDYGAISLHPHVFIGAAGIDPQDPEDVKDRNMCGAVMRMMRKDATWKAGGWDTIIEAGRNHEERTICSRLQTAGYKTGITSRIRAFHPFPPNWGYPPEFTPEMQKHNPDMEQYVQSFGNIDNYDNKTWLPK